MRSTTRTLYIWAEAHRRHWTQAWETGVLGDEASWIWNLADEHFYDSRRVVDGYHGSEHLGHAAESLYGEDNSPIKQRSDRKWHGGMWGQAVQRPFYRPWDVVEPPRC